MNLKKLTQGFTLIEMLVVIAIISILAAAIFPAITSAMDSARASALKNKGKGIWNAIMTANIEREPLSLPSLWPGDVDAQYSANSTVYFKHILSNGDKTNPTAPADKSDQLVEDIGLNSLTAPGVPVASDWQNLTKDNIAWRVGKVGSNSAGELTFLITKNVSSTEFKCTGPDDPNTLEFDAEAQPFGDKRAVWVTFGGSTMDARRKVFSCKVLFNSYKTPDSFEVLSMGD